MNVTYFSAITGAFCFRATLPADLLRVLATTPAPRLDEPLRAPLFVLLVFSVSTAG